MHVFHTDGLPPSHGKATLANIGWTRNKRLEPRKIVTENNAIAQTAARRRTTNDDFMLAIARGATETVFRYRTGTPFFSAGRNTHALAALSNIESWTSRGAPMSLTDSTEPVGEITSSITRRSDRLTSGDSWRGSCGRTAIGDDTPSDRCE